MPFTFSHPTIVIPLSKLSPKWFSLTGLVTGSVTPDFEYFLRMQIKSSFSHTYLGLIYFDLPFGICLTFVFHQLIRNDLYNNLPTWLAERVSAYRINWIQTFKADWFIISLSILIGAASHLLWDGFTHKHGLFVLLFPVLSSAIDVFQFKIPLYSALQHGSTIIGFALIFFFIRSLPIQKVTTRPLPIYWITTVVISFSIVIVRTLFGIDQNLIGQLVGTGVSGLLIALIIAPITLGKLQLFNR
jgi:hypothetical protein